MNTFSVSDSVRFGWTTFTKRPWFFAGITLLIMIVSAAVGMVGEMFGEEFPLVIVGGVVNFALSTLVGMGITAFFLKAHEAPESVESKALWHPQGFWRYLAAAILTGLVVIVGLFLLVVPGIIAALMLMFVSYIVIDRGFGPIQAMKESYRITKGNLWSLLGLFLAVAAINILGLLALIVGLLVSIPLTSLAMVHAYRTLEHQASEVAPATPVVSA